MALGLVVNYCVSGLQAFVPLQAHVWRRLIDRHWRNGEKSFSTFNAFVVPSMARRTYTGCRSFPFLPRKPTDLLTDLSTQNPPNRNTIMDKD